MAGHMPGMQKALGSTFGNLPSKELWVAGMGENLESPCQLEWNTLACWKAASECIKNYLLEMSESFELSSD